MVSIQAEEKNILFHYEFDPNLPSGIEVDEKRLRQVLLNLLENAVKFTSQGQVVFKVSSVTDNSLSVIDQGTEQKQSILFEIEDTGIGISSQHLAKIFQPFEQLGNLNSRSQGTGLGLSISKQLIGIMGSQLHVKSELGKGSSFWFVISLSPIEMSPTLPLSQWQRTVGYKGQKYKILIVDDKRENVLVLQNIIEPLGFEVLVAENGQQAINLVLEIKPDLILIDIFMPVKNGIEATQEMRQIPELKDLPIIAVSATVSQTQRHQYLEAGCHDFLSKPIDAELLLRKLEKYLKLEWIYESISDPASETTSKPLIAPPVEIVRKLTELAKKGRISLILAEAKQLEQQDRRWIAFSNHLHKLAEEFELEKINQFLSKYDL